MAGDPNQALKVFVDGIAHHVRMALLKPVRDMTPKEAFFEFMILVYNGQIQLYDPIRIDKDFNFVSPKMGEQIKIRTNIAGVEFWHANEDNSGRFGSKGAYLPKQGSKKDYFEPTAAFAVVLYRFATWLKTRWNVTKIVWGGIGHGSGKQDIDCHMSGHCIDFYGATTSAGVFDVRRDWFYQPVYLNDNYAQPKAYEDDLWGTSTHTNYRLMHTKDVEEREATDRAYWNPRARDFFLDVFMFIDEQCNHGDISAIAMRGGAFFEGGFTVHPDYPTALRRPHNDHIHFQLGLTFTK